jgi:hypothetical protein
MKSIYYLLILVAIFSCSKEDNKSDDKTAPVIARTSPSDDQAFNAGQKVDINSQITDNEKIYLVHVHISNQNTGQLLLDIHRYPDAAVYNLLESFIASAGLTYKIQLVARDANGNEISQSFFVSGI